MAKFNTESDFWDNVNIQNEDECWLWKGCLRSDGYGRMRWHTKYMLVHRLAWMFTNGEIPTGLEILHDPIKCTSRACCNPKHLRLGTQTEHNQDSAKIDWNIAREIRKRYKAFSFKNNSYALGKEFGIAFGIASCTVLEIVHNKAWIE